MERENQRVTITKRMLKEALLLLMKNKDLEKISVTELCRAADINRATFYRHYQIPGDVLFEIQKDLYLELTRNYFIPKSMDDLYPLFLRFCDFIEEHADLLRTLILCSPEDNFTSFLNNIYDDLWNQVKIMEFTDQLDAEDFRLLALYFCGGTHFILRSWLLGEIQKTPKQMADYLYNLMRKTNALILKAHPDLSCNL